MMGLLRYWKMAGVGLLLLAVIVTGRLVTHYRNNYLQAKQQVTEQKEVLAQQQALIATLHAEDARNRALMAEQQKKEQQLRQRGEIYQRKFREAIQGNRCAAERAPSAVLGLLRATDTNAADTNRSIAP